MYGCFGGFISQIRSQFIFYFFESPDFAALGAYISDYIRWPVLGDPYLIVYFVSVNKWKKTKTKQT